MNESEKIIQELESQILQLCERSPEASRYQYMIDCRLSHCKTPEERMDVILDLFQERVKALTTEYDNLSKRIKEFLDSTADPS